MYLNEEEPISLVERVDWGWWFRRAVILVLSALIIGSMIASAILR